jgi:putative two-component system response regulator
VSAAATVLLVEHDRASADFFRALLVTDRALRLVVAENAAEALRVARDAAPDLVVTDAQIVGTDVFAFLQALRGEPALDGALFLMIAEAGTSDLHLAGLHLGVDEYLARPLERAAVLAKLHAMLRLKRARDELRAEKATLDRLHAELRQSFDQLLRLLAGVLDMAVPGAAERGRRAARLAALIAARFEIPEPFLPDLELAARLHEIGRLVCPDDREGPAALSGDAPVAWLRSSRAILDQVEGLRGAAELVADMQEHWDGSGQPGHLRAGQIPLRSRILRAVVDFLERVERGGLDPAAALAALGEHGGTRYDPLVLTHLAAAVEDTGPRELAGDRSLLPVPALQEGMVLAEDLCTASGLKLLAANTRLTPGTLAVIRQRHRHEPILRGVAVWRPAA